MELIVKLFYSLLYIGLGVLLIKYRKNIHDWTGSWYWAEKYIGNGGTFLIIIFLGLFLIFLGALYPFGGLDLLTKK